MQTMPTDDALVRAPLKRRRIVIFADGTGNAFSQQESNVWRMYRALERGPGPDGAEQIALYIPGVGTASNPVIRAIDGATGFGVPSNVRKLYRFLCWNWREGDEIHMIGFSRGAFTLRTLAGMIRFQGLMPRDWPADGQGGEYLPEGYCGRPVTEAEMKRNVLAAWNGYRRQTAPFLKDGWPQMAPWIALIRALRDGIGMVWRSLRGQPQHQAVRDCLPPPRRPPPDSGPAAGDHIRIDSLGLFDTVEAYGVPVNGLREAFSRTFWPITFRNRVCSKVVKEADHLLSLDDERLTFHPIRFDQSGAGTAEAPTIIRELWFAGMHSDVGGGYPEDSAAMEPLLWMVQAAEARGLRFDATLIHGHARQRSPQAVIHDSRSGLGMAYRYQPRRKREGPAHGGTQVLHGSVIRKMDHGFDGYAPLLLPKAVQVNEGPKDWGQFTAMPLERQQAAAERVDRLIRWRRRNNRMQIGVAVAFVALPMLVLLWPGGAAPDWAELCRWAGAWFGVLGLKLEPLWQLYRPHWAFVLPLLAVEAGLYDWGRRLGWAIRDGARRVWQPPAPGGAAGVQPGGGGG